MTSTLETTQPERRVVPWPGVDATCPAWCEHSDGHRASDYPADRWHQRGANFNLV